MAWGLSYFKEGEAQAYRFNEIDTTEEGPWVDFFVETTALPYDLKLRFDVLNLTPGTIDRERRFFGTPGDGDPSNDDRNGPLFQYQRRTMQLDDAPFYQLQLSGVF